MTHSDLTAAVLEVERNNPFQNLRLIEENVRAGEPDSVLLAVDRFSLATNNLGYALLGDVLKSWDAYPSPTPGWGRVPVWGAARVLAAPESVAQVGTTVTGYLPMATHVAVRAESTDSGLLTLDEPRNGMLPIYRHLALDRAPASWDAHQIDVDTVMLAVFPFASVLAHDLLRDSARTVVVSSASSRSAAALSRLLADRDVDVIGLTSARNRAAVDSMGTYHRVLSYDDIDALPDATDVVYVDVAGAAEVTAAVHRRLGTRVTSSIVVGGTHVRSWPAESRGPEVTVFNTGDREQQLAAEIGRAAIEEMYLDARRTLVEWASPWLQVTRMDGLTAAGETWLAIAAGRSNPLSAVVIRP